MDQPTNQTPPQPPPVVSAQILSEPKPKSKRFLFIITTIIGLIFLTGIGAYAYYQNNKIPDRTIPPSPPLTPIVDVSPTEFLDKDELAPDTIETIIVTPENISQQTEEDSPVNQFAYRIPVLINPNTNGTWTEDENNTLIWRLRILSPNAVSLNLGFTSYRMPPNGKLIMYSPNKSSILGPFTANDNKEHNQLWTPIIPGDEIILELTLPKNELNQLDLELTAINHGFR